MKDKKVSLLDWRFKLGCFCLILMILLIIVALVLLATAFFNDQFNTYLGDGFWALHHYHLNDLLFHWTDLDDQAIVAAFTSHPFVRVYVALLFLIFFAPTFMVLGLGLITRWWVKTRI